MILVYFPLLILVLAAYNVIVFFTDISLGAEIFHIGMLSGGVWVFRVSDLLTAIALALLFFEVLKSTRTGAGTIVDHFLSTVVFVIALIEFILLPEAATSTFFLILMVTFIDVVAGFSVTIRSARRDVALGHPDALI